MFFFLQIWFSLMTSLQLADVTTLSEDSMREELSNIGLSSIGMESELRARLVRYFTNSLQHTDLPATSSSTTTNPLSAARVVANRHAQQQQQLQARAHRQTLEGVDEALQAFRASLMPEETDARTKDGQRIRMKTFVRADSAVAYVPESVVLGKETSGIGGDGGDGASGVPKKRRMMDELKEEFSRRQQQSQSSGPHQHHHHQRHNHEAAETNSRSAQLTPNIYLGQVHGEAHEEALYRLFSLFGEVESIKIMWPRSMDATPAAARHTNGAFVSMSRFEDAEAAFHHLSNKVVFDRQFRMEWTKPPLTPQAAVQLDDLLLQKRLKVPYPLHVFVLPPPHPALHALIDETAELVARRGDSYEAFLVNDHNPDFDWLRYHDSPIYQYYQWRKLAFENGDTASSWRLEPIQLGAVTWFPPPMLEPRYLQSERGDSDAPPTIAAAVGSGHSYSDRLHKNERHQLEMLLAELTPERSTIGSVMVYAMDHADRANEIVQLIVERLTSAATPVAAKIVYLFVISDILHNCGNADIPKAAHYRTGFESRLPGVMQCFNDALNATTSRISSQLLKDRVLQVLRVWQTWSLFSDIFITGLQTTFLAAPIETAPVAPAPIDTTAISTGTGNENAGNRVDVDDNDDEDLDGAPISAHELPSEFDALDDRQLRIKCRTMGVPEGERKDMLSRLKIATIVASQVAVANAWAGAAVTPTTAAVAVAVPTTDDDDIDGMPL
jgi:hypothetical protein